MSILFNNLPKKIIATLEKMEPEPRGSQILSMMEKWLLDDEQQEFLNLNPWNIFFLYAAAHLFGIQTSNFSKDNKLAVLDPSHHHLDKLGLEDKAQAKIIRLICSYSNEQDLSRDIDYKGKPINVNLLSGTIGLATALDLENQETTRDIASDLISNDKMSLDQFRSGFKLLSSGPHAFLPGTIRVRLSCNHPDVHRALKHYETRLQKRLHQLNSQVSPRFLFSEIIFEIEPEDYTPLDMKFSVDSMAALKLFTGNRLYSDKRVFLRELIQNAVDACNLKKIYNTVYTPEISIHFDDQLRVINFKDNGIGMDRQWLEKYFLKIGISFYQSGDIKTVNHSSVDFNFISKFGIGFLSSFLVSDKIVITTRKEGAPGLQITITNLQDYFDVRVADENCPCGTQICLHLKETKYNYSRFMDYVCYLKTNIRYLTIPVQLLDYEGETCLLGNEKLAYDKDNHYKCDFIAPLDFKDSEAYLFLKAKRNLDHFYGLEFSRGGISIFQDGIFVTQTDTLLPEGARQSVIGRINLTGDDRCELSMDRNRIFWTEQQLQNIKRTIRLGMVDLANQLINVSQNIDPPLTIETSLIQHLAIFFDFNEIDDEMYQLLGAPVRKIVAKRFQDFIRVNFAHTGENRHVPEADGYTEKWQQDVLTGFSKKSRPPLQINRKS